ncbi:MAG: peroxiredoxin [Candidatus Thioglobus sp.]|nr:peroxiredoxin [Candidatus Thioglobus sp.]
MPNQHKKLGLKAFILLILLSIFSCSMADLEVGDMAPNFTLEDQTSEMQSLSDYKGKWVVLYFYPKDDTPGCTTQACEFRDATERIIASKAVVFGVSIDSIESHKEFAEKYQISFSLLSDESGRVSKQYDSLNDLFVFKVSKRNTFIVDPQGKIARIYLSVKPQGHAEMVLNELGSLQQTYQ